MKKEEVGDITLNGDRMHQCGNSHAWQYPDQVPRVSEYRTVNLQLIYPMVFV